VADVPKESDSGVEKPVSAEEYVDRGDAYYANDDVDSAIADYTEAIRIDRKLAKAYYNRAIAYKNKGDIDKAIADYTEAFEDDDSGIDQYYYKAIEDCHKAIKLNPDDAKAYYILGRVYSSFGEPQCNNLAIENYDAAIRLDPSFAKAYLYRGYAYFIRGFRRNLRIHGNAPKKKADYDLAIADFNEAMRLYPDDEDAYKKEEIGLRRSWGVLEICFKKFDIPHSTDGYVPKFV